MIDGLTIIPYPDNNNLNITIVELPEDDIRIPHVHIYTDKKYDENKCAHISLCAPVYINHEYDLYLNNNQLLEFHNIISSPSIKILDNNPHNRIWGPSNILVWEELVSRWDEVYSDMWNENNNTKSFYKFTDDKYVLIPNYTTGIYNIDEWNKMTDIEQMKHYWIGIYPHKYTFKEV